MNFMEKRTLQQRGANESEPDTEVDVFLIGGTCVLSWASAHRSTGYDSNRLYPAWVAGKRAFVRHSNWCPSHGHSASGSEERILTFDEGVALLVEHHVYEFPVVTGKRDQELA